MRKPGARSVQSTMAMWVNDAQRDRIFEMIGTHSVTYHRVRNARLEFQRRVTVGVLLGAGLLWVLIATVRNARLPELP